MANLILWIIVVIGLFLVIRFLHMEHQLKKVKVIVLLLVLILIYFSIVSLGKSRDLELDSPAGVVNAVYTYFGWLGETGSRLFDVGKDSVIAIGNAIKGNQTEKNSFDGRK